MPCFPPRTNKQAIATPPPAAAATAEGEWAGWTVRLDAFAEATAKEGGLYEMFQRTSDPGAFLAWVIAGG